MPTDRERDAAPCATPTMSILPVPTNRERCAAPCATHTMPTAGTRGLSCGPQVWRALLPPGSYAPGSVVRAVRKPGLLGHIFSAAPTTTLATHTLSLLSRHWLV
eukprot:30011-Chlamydomonas_euryale.AAC.7